jgi:hypothetical protein
MMESVIGGRNEKAMVETRRQRAEVRVSFNSIILAERRN